MGQSGLLTKSSGASSAMAFGEGSGAADTKTVTEVRYQGSQ
jgi:hypothetical protein